MQPIWVLEANVPGLPTEALAAEVIRQGMQCHVVKQFAWPYPSDLAGAEKLPRDACVIFRGSLTLMQHIAATRKWSPNAWCSPERFACSTYYAHFGPYLLNRDYSLIPFAEMTRLSDRLFARHGSAGRLFVRPDAVTKNFPGVVLDVDEFATKFAKAPLDPTLLVLVANYRRVGNEWRLIVANGEIIAGSQYRDAGKSVEYPNIPDEVREFAQGVLRRVSWTPAPLFVMDVCSCEDGFRLVELNSFGCSGHYAADLPTVVKAASRIAGSFW